MGRFTKQKNYFYLVDEFELFLKKISSRKISNYRRGELREKIHSEVKKKKLEKNISIIGKTNNVYKYMIHSKALIHPSLCGKKSDLY